MACVRQGESESELFCNGGLYVWDVVHVNLIEVPRHFHEIFPYLKLYGQRWHLGLGLIPPLLPNIILSRAQTGIVLVKKYKQKQHWECGYFETVFHCLH